MGMKEISIDNLRKFEDAFNVDREKHMVIILTIKTFIYRFEKFPELRNKAKLYALTDNWENDGNFFMTFHVDSEFYVYLDTIHDNYDLLKSAIKSLNFSSKIELYCVRNEFYDMTKEICDELGIDLEIEADTTCYHLPMEKTLEFEIQMPQNYHIGELKDEHVEKINSIWPHRFEGSENYISFTIKYHVSVGIFDEQNDLAAWCLFYDNGALAILQTDPNHQRKGLASVAIKVLSKLVAMDHKCDLIATIVHKNQKSINLFTKLGFQKLGPHSWYILRKEKN